MQAKEEIIVRCKFTIRTEKYQEIEDFGEVARGGKAWFGREVRSMISEAFPDADNIQVGAQYFIHERPEREIVTYRDDFLSKMQDAPVHGSGFLPGTPQVCRNGIYGGGHKAPCTGAKVTDTPQCAECWDEAMKQVYAPDWSEIERECE